MFGLNHQMYFVQLLFWIPFNQAIDVCSNQTIGQGHCCPSCLPDDPICSSKCPLGYEAILSTGRECMATDASSTNNVVCMKCPYGHYFDIKNLTRCCHPVCLSCTGPWPGNCTECVVELNGKCVTACPEGYVESEVPNENIQPINQAASSIEVESVDNTSSSRTQSNITRMANPYGIRRTCNWSPVGLYPILAGVAVVITVTFLLIVAFLITQRAKTNRKRKYKMISNLEEVKLGIIKSPQPTTAGRGTPSKSDTIQLGHYFQLDINKVPCKQAQQGLQHHQSGSQSTVAQTDSSEKGLELYAPVLSADLDKVPSSKEVKELESKLEGYANVDISKAQTKHQTGLYSQPDKVRSIPAVKEFEKRPKVNEDVDISDTAQTKHEHFLKPSENEVDEIASSIVNTEPDVIVVDGPNTASTNDTVVGGQNTASSDGAAVADPRATSYNDGAVDCPEGELYDDTVVPEPLLYDDATIGGSQLENTTNIYSDNEDDVDCNVIDFNTIPTRKGRPK